MTSALLSSLPPPPTNVPEWQGILFGTISAPLAVVFTNPFDTTKVLTNNILNNSNK